MTEITFDDLIPAAAKGGADDVSFDDLIPQGKTAPNIEPNELRAFGHGVASGLTFGTNDEIEAAIRSGIGLWGDYDKELSQARANLDLLEEKHPWISFAGEVVGGGVTGAGMLRSGLSAAAKIGSSTMGKRILGAAGDGAIGGALYGFGSGEGGIANRTVDAVEGGLFGAGAGGAAGLAIEGIGKGLRKGSEMLGRSLPKEDAATALSAQATADEFGIPLTRGQASGNINQLAREDTFRNAGGSPGASEAMKKMDEVQRIAMGDATDTIKERLGGIDMMSQSEAGDTIAEALKKKAADARRTATENYEKAESIGASIRSNAVENMSQEILKTASEDVIFDATLTPAAMKGLSFLDELSTKAKEAGAGGVSLQDLNQVRKKLNQLTGSTPEDGRAVRETKRAFDQWVDDAFDKELLTGSPEALEALKTANAEWRKYRGYTSPSKGDDAGKIIKKMVDEDADGMMVANWLFGRSMISASDTAFKVARKLKYEFGQNSDEWNAARQGLWLRMTRFKPGGDMPGAAALAKSIREGIEGKGQHVAKVVFSPEERQTMLRFADVVESTVTPATARNPSNSGNRMAGIINSFGDKIMTGLGFYVGGADLGMTTLVTRPVMRNYLQTLQARAATSPVPASMAATPGPRQGMVATGQQAEQAGEAAFPQGLATGLGQALQGPLELTISAEDLRRLTGR